MDDHLSAAELMASRGLDNKDIRSRILPVPGTDIYVFRLEPGPGGIPACRVYVRDEGETVVLVALDPITEE